MLMELIRALRLVAVTLIATSGLYVLAVYGGAQWLFPAEANGSLVERDGHVVGARLIAQPFHAPRYVWPRPSAVGWAASAAGGSNLSPAGEPLARLAAERLSALGASQEHLAPAELVTASGSGLDPHLTLAGALFQAPRIAAARGVDEAAVRALMMAAGGGATHEPGALIEVLALNLRLDRELPSPR